MNAVACSTAADPLPATRPATGGRFVFIDALRGLAACGVLACHFVPKPPFVVPVLDGSLRLGSLGVEIFFVISGFVIAYSVRKDRITPAFLGNFAVRRSLRLDPPYWVTIACVVLAGALCHRLLPTAPYEPCTSGQLASHLVYMQTMFGYKDLCTVFWTLRLEVLFYLMFILTLGLVQIAERRAAASWAPRIRQAVFLSLATLSLTAFALDRGPGVLKYWHMFLLGATLWWSLSAPSGRWVFWSLPILMVASLAIRPNLEVPIALAAALLVYTAGRLGRLESWLAWPWLQYLGRISYSLYLIHVPVRDTFQAVGSALTGGDPIAAQCFSLAALAASFGAAHLLHRWVEVPTMELARRWKQPASARPATNGADALSAA
jgi:peptidoglycan/LPS O-acetylase OafA/YrhL